MPSFDPNGFNEGLGQRLEDIDRKPDAPLTNGDLWPIRTGSTFKLAVMLALEAGIPPERQYFYTGFTELGDQHFLLAQPVWLRHDRGDAGTCDVYFYELSSRRRSHRRDGAQTGIRRAA